MFLPNCSNLLQIVAKVDRPSDPSATFFRSPAAWADPGNHEKEVVCSELSKKSRRKRQAMLLLFQKCVTLTVVLLHSGFFTFFDFCVFLRVESEHVEKVMKSDDFSASIRFYF